MTKRDKFTQQSVLSRKVWLRLIEGVKSVDCFSYNSALLATKMLEHLEGMTCIRMTFYKSNASLQPITHREKRVNFLHFFKHIFLTVSIYVVVFDPSWSYRT